MAGTRTNALKCAKGVRNPLIQTASVEFRIQYIYDKTKVQCMGKNKNNTGRAMLVVVLGQNSESEMK